MKNKLYIKRVFYINLFLAIIAGVIVFLFQLPNEKHSGFPFLSLMGFLIVFAVSTLNILWLKKIHIYPSKKYLFYFLSYLTAGIVYLILWPPFSHLTGSKWSYDNYGLHFILLLSSAVLNTTILLFQHFILLQQEKARTQIQVSQLKAANIEASNLLLKQQIQPHFLFNSLSNLKALYNEDQEAGEKYLVNLANFLRASISNQNQKVSTLKDELDFLHDYLEMQQIRFANALEYNIIIDPSVLEKYYLPSFSLQLLVENAIKHNDITTCMPLRVKIYQQDDQLIICNNIQKKQSFEFSTGQGLANLSERYRLLSGDSIEIQQDEHQFIVTLRLLQDGNINY